MDIDSVRVAMILRHVNYVPHFLQAVWHNYLNLNQYFLQKQLYFTKSDTRGDILFTSALSKFPASAYVFCYVIFSFVKWYNQ